MMCLHLVPKTLVSNPDSPSENICFRGRVWDLDYKDTWLMYGIWMLTVTCTCTQNKACYLCRCKIMYSKYEHDYSYDRAQRERRISHLEHREVLADARIGPRFLLPEQLVQGCQVGNRLPRREEGQQIRRQVLRHLAWVPSQND